MKPGMIHFITQGHVNARFHPTIEKDKY